MSSESFILKDVTCLACGCLCDDIRVEVEGGRIVEADRACSIGRPWFLADRQGVGIPDVSIDGRPGELSEAIDRAAGILRESKAPVVWGLSGSTIEAVRSALAIADRIGAVVELSGAAEAAARLEAFQRVGQVSASLGEVKDRADVVLFWGVDPLRTHPRHWERYSVEPRGKFIPDGRTGRFVIVIDAQLTETGKHADLFIPLEPARQAETLRILRSMLRGIAIDPDRAERASGVPYSTIENLFTHLQKARYGATFFGPSLGGGAEGRRAHEAMLTLIRDLNEARRFVGLELGEPGNPSGAASVLSWQAGAPSSVDFGAGYPRHLPGEASLKSRLDAGQVDAVLIVGETLPDAITLKKMVGVRSIRLWPVATEPMTSTVSINVARPGIETGGTVARIDGVMLPLRPLVPSHLPTDRQVLDAISERLQNSQ